jgi:hypothetical protein
MAALAGEVGEQWYDDRGVSGLRTACSTVSKEIPPSITRRPSPASAAAKPGSLLQQATQVEKHSRGTPAE